PSAQSRTQPHPDSEWDRRLQMALVEETVRSHGAAAAPDWIETEGDPEPQPDESTFFEEGQWDLDGPGEGDGYAEPLPEKRGGRLIGVASMLRPLSPGRFLRRRRAGPPADALPAEAVADAAGEIGDRIEPGFDMPAADAPTGVERRTSVRSIAIEDPGE